MLQKLKGKGTVVIPTLNDKMKFINDTLFTPTLKKELTFSMWLGF